MITRIYADNFRCLGNFEFRPKQLNLLLGENGSGKTSLFEVLLLIRDLVVGGRSASSLFAFKKTVWDLRQVQSFELDIEGPEGVFTYRLKIRHPAQPSSEQPCVEEENVDFDGKPLFRYGEGQVRLFDDAHEPGATFPFKSEHSFLPNLEAQSLKLSWFKAFVAGIHVFQLNPFFLDQFSSQDERFLHLGGKNFASWLRYLSEERPRARSDAEERLKEIIPGFLGFRFQAFGNQKGLLATFYLEDKGSYELPFGNLSEGQRILSILYATLYGLVGEASVLCFDEPENFISLQEVQPWLQELRDLVEERSGQALVISHHPEVIDYLASDSAFRFTRPDGDLVRVAAWTPSEIMKPSEILVRGD